MNPRTLQQPSLRRVSYTAVPQAAIVHIDVSHKRVHRNSINSANIHRALRHPPNLIRTAVLYGIQRSIILCILRSTPISLRFRIVIVQAFSPELLVDCTLCFFLTGCQMFHKSFCQAMLLCCAFFKFLHLKVLSEIVAILKFSFLGFIAFQSMNITCLVLSFTSYPIND